MLTVGRANVLLLLGEDSCQKTHKSFHGRLHIASIISRCKQGSGRSPGFERKDSGYIAIKWLRKPNEIGC